MNLNEKPPECSSLPPPLSQSPFDFSEESHTSHLNWIHSHHYALTEGVKSYKVPKQWRTQNIGVIVAEVNDFND